jgi:hypothetical protein
MQERAEIDTLYYAHRGNGECPLSRFTPQQGPVWTTLCTPRSASSRAQFLLPKTTRQNSVKGQAHEL